MSDESRFTELMHAEIDGVNSAQESSELHAFLARDPVARQHFDQLKQTAESLDALEEVAPPAGLTESVMTAVRRSPSREKFDDSGQFRDSRPVANMIVRYAYAMAAGVIVGVLGYHWATSGGVGPSLDPSGVSGTMTTHEVASNPAEELEFDFAGASGTARLEPSAPGFSLALDLTSEEALEVELGYDGNAVGFAGLRPGIGGIDALEIHENGIRWRQQNHRSVVVSLDNPGETEATIELRFSIAGQRVHEVALSLPGSGRP